MKKLFVLLCMTLVLAGSGSLMAQKFAHINSADLLEIMPEVKTTDVELQKYQSQLEEQNQAMLKEYELKLTEFKAQESVLADAVKEVKITEITDLEERIQSFQSTAQQKLANKKEELYGPIFEKAKKTIEEVAKAKGYDYVFDTSLGFLLTFPSGDDLLPAVKKKLNL